MRDSLIVIIVTILLSVLTVVLFLKWKKDFINRYQLGTQEVITTIVQHDTIIKEIAKEKVKLVEKVKTVYIHDTIVQTTLITKDTTACLTISEIMEDGANITASICSDKFTYIPTDITGDISYIPAPDTIKHFTQVDTVKIPQKLPYEKILSGVLIGVLAGFFTSQLAK